MNLTFTRHTAMFRTPAKIGASSQGPADSPTFAGRAGPSNLSVRRHIGEWEAGQAEPHAKSPVNPKPDATPSPPPTTTKKVPSSRIEKRRVDAAKILEFVDIDSPPKPTYANRTAEAKACLIKAKLQLNSSKNTKNDIKHAVIQAAERLYQLVKEIEAELKAENQKTVREESERTESEPVVIQPTPCQSFNTSEVLLTIEKHSKLLVESNKKMEELKETLDHQSKLQEQGNSYASVAAAQGVKSLPKCSTLHSVVVTSKDEHETGDQVLSRVRKAVNAKDGWIKVEKVRKAKDRKITIGLETKEERSKIRDRLQKEGANLTVEEVQNKDPLLVLRNVLVANTDEDVLTALRNQNRSVFNGLDSEESRVVVKYRRRTRNPHTGHVIVSVSPTIWRRALDIGTVHIDLQRVRVEDQTPLVQCTRCLGFGHGKRFCKEPADLCGHCGGPHMRAECSDWLSGSSPVCRNCAKANIDNVTPHNAFSHDCPVRHKWDDIARSTVAYC